MFMNLKTGELLLRQIHTVWMIVMDLDTDRNTQTQQVCGVHERKGSQSSGACWHNKPATDRKTKTVHERVPPQAQHPEAVHQG